MIRRKNIRYACAIAVCSLAATVGAAHADEMVSAQELSDEISVVEEQQEEIEVFDQDVEKPDDEVEIEAYNHADASAGYRFVGVSDAGGRAAEYDYLHSSVTGDARLVHLGKDLKVDVDGAFLNRKDYAANLMFDYAGYYRLTARTESLYHNLDHEKGDLIFQDLDSADRYGITTRQDMVQFRYKLHDYPIHLNLSHWFIDRKGSQQLRYADFSFDDFYPADSTDPVVSRLRSQSRRIDRSSQETTAGFDAHLGPVNVVYAFQYRQFDDDKSTPLDRYFVLDEIESVAEHNDTPESRYYAHTVKLFTSPAGGVTGAVSYSHGTRENRSSLATVRGADDASDTLQNAAGDFTYSPCAWFTTVLKYRHQEIDRDTPSSLLAPAISSSPIVLRQAMDTRRDIISANFTIRPNTVISFNGEYRGQFHHRDGTGTPDSADRWNLPENSDTHRGTLTVLFRPFKGLRIRGLYGYTTTNNPLYDSDPEQKHEGRLLASYTNSSRWGLSAKYLITREFNDHISRTTHPEEVTEDPLTYVLPGDRRYIHASAGLWVTPIERLTVSGNFGFLRDKADQAVLFASVLNGQDADAEYVSQGEIYSVNAAYHATEDVDLSLAYQLVRSRSVFKPESSTSDGTPTAGVSTLSRVKTQEHSLSARATYRVTKHFGCALDYTYRAYNNRLSSDGDGAVHAVTALLKTTW